MASGHSFVVTLLLLVFLGACLNPVEAKSRPKNCTAGQNTVTFGGKTTTYSGCVGFPRQGIVTWNVTGSMMEGVYYNTPDSTDGYVAWGHSTAESMAGGEVLVAGLVSGAMAVNFYKLPSQKDMEPADVSEADPKVFGIKKFAGESDQGVFKIWFQIQLANPSATVYTLHAWGPTATGGNDDSKDGKWGKHQGLAKSVISVNYATGDSSASKDNTETLYKAHAILNAASWGIAMPIGVMFARYVRPFADPFWYNIHRSLQGLAGLVGLVGFILGPYVTKSHHTAHRAVGYLLVILLVLQVLAVWVRPPLGVFRRHFWNLFHHVFGYGIILLSLWQMNTGFEIYESVSQLDSKYKKGYWGIVIALAIIAAVAELACLLRFGLYWLDPFQSHMPWMVKKHQAEAAKEAAATIAV